MKSSTKGGTKMKGGHKPPTNAGPLVAGNPKVAAEAESGGSHFKDGGKVHGKKSMMRLDRPGRKMGGRVGADCSPLASSAKTSGRSDSTESN